ncbi:MAG: phosphoenolpyruvate--protein phosphotransferase [Rhodospirillaceae bacterium]|nr:phosphoenolpyruvate--protein phosphotransferase [Rhodospirillaceae bacterium]
MKTSTRGIRSSSSDRRREVILRGIGVSQGIAIGPAHVVESAAVDVPEYRIPKSAVAKELDRFDHSAAKSREQLEKLADKAKDRHGAAGEELGYLLDAHIQMLGESRLIRGVRERIANDLVNAEAAVSSHVNQILRVFAAFDDPNFTSKGDEVREVGSRLIRNLTRTPYRAFSGIEDGAVIIAEEMSPSDTALLDPRRVAGFAAAMGGAEGHTAIMARALDLPAVLGIAGLAGRVQPGMTVIVDGIQGQVIVNPDGATIAEYRKKRANLLRQRRELARLRDLPAVTRDGLDITLLANIELPAEIAQALAAGAEGIGLLRSEFMFMNRAELPGEDEQYETLREIVESMGGKPVTFRTLDVGGDKLVGGLAQSAGGSANPALGLRAIRLSLSIQKLLEIQLAAMLRAAAHGPVRLLLPMITSAREVVEVRTVLARVFKRLKRQGVAIPDEPPPVGAMVETPAAALAADALARTCDFLSIGTNDLTMYTLAVDRGDERVAALYDPRHQAVLRLIQFTAAAGAREHVPVALCGEMAGDPANAGLLIGLGLTELSMAPGNLARVKKRIRGLEFGATRHLADTVMLQTDPDRVAEILAAFEGAS